MTPTIVSTQQEVVRGDDYKAAEGRALTWFSPDWPNLAGAVLTMVAGYKSSNIYGSLPSKWQQTLPSSPETREAFVELTAAQTTAMLEGFYDYTLTALLRDGDHVTLAIGSLTVESEPGQAPLAP